MTVQTQVIKPLGRNGLNVTGSISQGNHRKATLSLQIGPNNQSPCYIQLTEINLSQFIPLHLVQGRQNIKLTLDWWSTGKMFDFTSFKLYAHVIKSRGGIQFASIKCRENTAETELCLQ